MLGWCKFVRKKEFNQQINQVMLINYDGTIIFLIYGKFGAIRIPDLVHIVYNS